jgi:hypothetical protein
LFADTRGVSCRTQIVDVFRRILEWSVVTVAAASQVASRRIAMNQHVITTAPLGFRYRRAVIAIGIAAMLAVAVGAVVTALESGGTGSTVRQAAPAAPVPPALRLCGNDTANLLGAMATMPPSAQAHVAASLSPVLGDAVGSLAMFVDPAGLTAPDSTTLGQILTRVSREDRATIISGLSEAQQSAVSAAWQRANTVEYLSSTAAPCS